MPLGVIWPVDQIPESEQSKKVHQVRVTIHSLGPVADGGQLSQNHWTIELLIPGGCIRLDMTLYDPTSSTDFRGVLKLSLLPYQLSQNHVTYFDYNVVGAKVVGHFTNDIITNGRQKYKMTSTGVGCRHWM